MSFFKNLLDNLFEGDTEDMNNEEQVHKIPNVVTGNHTKEYQYAGLRFVIPVGDDAWNNEPFCVVEHNDIEDKSLYVYLSDDDIDELNRPHICICPAYLLKGSNIDFDFSAAVSPSTSPFKKYMEFSKKGFSDDLRMETSHHKVYSFLVNGNKMFLDCVVYDKTSAFEKEIMQDIFLIIASSAEAL